VWNSALQECPGTVLRKRRERAPWNSASGRMLRNNAPEHTPDDWLWKSGSVGLFQGPYSSWLLAQWFRAYGTSSHGLHDLQIAEEVKDLPLRHPWLFHRSSTEAHAVR